MNRPHGGRRKEKQYMLLYTLTYMAIGTLTPLIGQYLAGIGMGGTQVGMITSAGTLTAVFANPFWGRIYTHRGRRHRLLACLCFAAAAVSLAVRAGNAFWLILPCFILLYFFQAPVMSLSDALAIDDGVTFGHVRTLGAVGFAFAVFAAAHIASDAGADKIFVVYSLCYTAAAIVILAISSGSAGGHAAVRAASPAFKENTVQSQAGRRRLFSALLHNRDYITLVLCAFFINGTDVANNTFFSFLYIKAGGTMAGVGVAFLLMAGSEAPFMAASGWLVRRFGRGSILLAAMAVSLLRFGWYAFEPPWQMLLAFFALQGFVNGITLVEFVRFAADLVPAGMRGAAIALYYALGSSASTIVCQAAGGMILDRCGAGGVYLFFALFNAAGLLLFVISGLFRRSGKSAGQGDG